MSSLFWLQQKHQQKQVHRQQHNGRAQQPLQGFRVKGFKGDWRGGWRKWWRWGEGVKRDEGVKGLRRGLTVAKGVG